ncbi:MAG: phosphoenolpyruvate synthase, partial [Saprospiraceae bacterium]|nr:phosphoenolpyruvate synthase [Saprospiraceae bacterium]
MNISYPPTRIFGSCSLKAIAAAALFLLFAPSSSLSQSPTKISDAEIERMVAKFKTDSRGPYRDIRWYCKTGEVLPPSERCPTPGGVQRARYREEVVSLAEVRHVFLGQILSTTSKEDFWDEANYQSRLKQYQLEKFLRTADNGWVLRRAQFYRGAFQVEDEEAWGLDFLNWLLSDTLALKKQFFLLRQAVRDIPHYEDDSRTQNIRAVSKQLSDEYSPFMDLRIKIHGQPEAADIPKVEAFRDRHRNKLSQSQLKKFDQLLADMKAVYKPADLNSLKKHLAHLPDTASLHRALSDFIADHAHLPPGCDKTVGISDMLWEIRTGISHLPDGRSRLALLDISNALEEVIFKEISAWKVEKVNDALEKIYHLGKASAGAGFVEIWEWEAMQDDLSLKAEGEVKLKEFTFYLDRARSLVEWGVGMTRAVYSDVIGLFSGFEPLAYGFLDDRIRSSVLLPLGDEVGDLGDFISAQSSLSNQVLDISNQSQVRGINPGFAMGELVVIDEASEDMEVAGNKIYVFNRPPSDLKPVAGIATVTEGNMVSHVQLLARNLGIP